MRNLTINSITTVTETSKVNWNFCPLGFSYWTWSLLNMIIFWLYLCSKVHWNFCEVLNKMITIASRNHCSICSGAAINFICTEFSMHVLPWPPNFYADQDAQDNLDVLLTLWSLNVVKDYQECLVWHLDLWMMLKIIKMHIINQEC